MQIKITITNPDMSFDIISKMINFSMMPNDMLGVFDYKKYKE